MRLAISGRWHHEDDHWLEGWEVKLWPRPLVIEKKDVEKIADWKPDAFLALAFADGVYRLPGLGLDKISCPKGVWFLDSHMQLQHELRAAPLFDCQFVAHSEFIPEFKRNGGNPFWIPCCLHRMPKTGLKKEPTNRSYDLVFMHYDHGGDRGEIGTRFAKAAERRGWSTFVGQKWSDWPSLEKGGYIDTIRGAKIGLNVSLKNDLNIRTFEILGCGVPLLMDRTPDFEKLSDLRPYAVLFDRHNHDPGPLLEEAEKLIPEAGRAIEVIRENHCLVSRVKTMLNHLGF